MPVDIKPAERDRVVLAPMKFGDLYRINRQMTAIYSVTCRACNWTSPEEPTIERAHLDLIGHCSMRGHTPPPTSWREFV